MKPVLFEIPGVDIPIHSYGVMVVVGFILAIIVSTSRAKDRSFDPNIILDLGIYVIVFGIIGARVWFVLQFRREFDMSVLNILDTRLSVIGAVVGAAITALLYFYRGRIGFLRKLRAKGKNVKLTFVLIGVVATLLFARVFYCLFEREANVNIAYINEPFLFYPESFRREVVAEAEHSPALRSQSQANRVVRVIGKYSSGPNLSKPDIVAYEFPKYIWDSGEIRIFRPNDALDYLAVKGESLLRFQKAFHYDFFEIWKGGLVYFGGVIGAVMGGILFSYKRRVPFWKLADLVAPGVALGLAAGRMGCLLNGCCWGKVPQTLLPQSVRAPLNQLAQRVVAKGIPLLDRLSYSFPRRSGAFKQHLDAGLLTETASRSLPVYPTQAIESTAAICLFLIVLAFSRHKKREGEEILLLGILYAVARFFIELLRADNEPEYLFGLTISQTTGILIFIFCAFLFVLRRLIAKPVGIEKAEVRTGKHRTSTRG